MQGSIPSTRLVAAYRDSFGYDASARFRDIDSVGLYGCDTGYRFYYPFSLTGDESLYRCLEKFEWNYKDDKWEHGMALSHIGADDKVLDVGCGEGNFLAKAKAIASSVSGIELNKQAARIAEAKGIRMYEELLGDHAMADHYDVVTSFQVLEHVPDPLDFIKGCIRVLRPGGTLLIGVPNDDSFLRLDPDAVLNQPPHHMGLWNRKSLTAVAQIAGLDVHSFETEPLAETDWYQAVIERTYLSKWQRRLFHRLGFAKVFQRYVKENAHTIAGHTIMAILKKRSADPVIRHPAHSGG